MTRFAAAPLARPQRFEIESVEIDGARLDADAAPQPVDGEFAPSLYIDLTDEEKLTAPSFELLPAGFSVGGELRAGGEVAAPGGYDEVVIDSARPRRPVRHRAALPELLLAAARRTVGGGSVTPGAPRIAPPAFEAGGRTAHAYFTARELGVRPRRLS